MLKISFFRNKYLIFLLSFFSPMIINIGGEVSPSFLFILGTFPFWVKYIQVEKNIYFWRILKCFLVIIAVQLLWIPFASTTLFLQLKAVLITTSGLIVFLFYSIVFKDNIKLIKWHVLGAFVASFVFVNVLAEIQGEEFGYWKFQVYPRIVSLLVCTYLFFNHKKFVVKYAPAAFFLVGLLGISTGARSASLGVLLSSVFAFILLNSKKLNLSVIKRQIVVSLVVLYALYTLLYVPRVLDGRISGDNTKQLIATENPYNPFNLVMMGRTDSVIPFIAFLDNPITGWGWLALDPNNKYKTLLFNLRAEEDYTIKTDDHARYIPGHSVLGYYSCSYGIIVFVAFLVMFKNLIIPFYSSILVKDRYLIYRFYVVISMFWNFLFSPSAHLKYGIPISCAILLCISIYVNDNYVDRPKRIKC